MPNEFCGGDCDFDKSKVANSGASTQLAHIVDFVCLDKMLIVEVDGSQHASCVKDEQRTAWLERHGYGVLRFWNNQVLAEVEALVEKIRLFFSDCTPHPSSPEAGGASRSE